MNLFPAEAWARASDPDTAQEAAQSVQGERANQLEKLVIKTLKEKGPLTTWEITAATGVNWSSIGPRMKPLERKNLVVKTAEKRMSPNGRLCIVYTAL